MKTLIAIVAVVLLAGCADMELYYKSVDAANIELTKVAIAEATAEAAKVTALGKFAEGNDPTAKAAAVLALALSGRHQQGAASRQVVTPQVPQASQALQWAQALAAPAVQLTGLLTNARVTIKQSENATALGIRQSENATALGISTNSTFANMNLGGLKAVGDLGLAGFKATSDIANLIQAPAANVTTSTVTTLSGSGVIGNGTYSTADSHDVTTTTDRHDVTTTDRHDTVDNHTTNPTTTVQIPPGKTCTVDAKGVLTCI